MKQGVENMSKNQLLELIQEMNNQLSEKDNQLQNKDAYIEQLKRIAFGSKSERFKKQPIDKAQLSLPFDELAAKDENSTEETVKEVISYTRKKTSNHKGRNSHNGQTSVICIPWK